MSETFKGQDAHPTAPKKHKYTRHDAARMLSETHSNTLRSHFARDRARLLHSSALRRLAAKTQVLSPNSRNPQVDSARTRLTHSLEVAQIGRELASFLGVDPDIVDTACLAHDLGHPPFGHNGEKAINDWMIDYGGFEGNAQTLRILVSLEPKIVDSNGVSYGLNLSRASLDASCKYPWYISDGVLDASSQGRKKFGVYEQEKEVFAWMRLDAPGRALSMEAQIMDLSDDIAYSVHDFEDAIIAGFIDPQLLNDTSGHDVLLQHVANWSGNTVPVQGLAEAFERLSTNKLWPSAWQGSHADLARLKNLTSYLIGRFVTGAVDYTIAHHAGSSFGRYSANVYVPDFVRTEIALLKGIVAAYVMESDKRQALYDNQRSLLSELLEKYYSTGADFLDPIFAERWHAANSENDKRRIIADQVASFTDNAAYQARENLFNNPYL